MLLPITLPTDPSDGAPPVAAFVVVPRRRLPSATDERTVASILAASAGRCVLCRGCVVGGICAVCGEREVAS